MTESLRPSLLVFHRMGQWTSALEGWRRWALAALLGIALSAALPPVYALPLLFVAFTGLMWLIDGSRNGRAAAAIGWWFGFGHFLTGIYWIALAFFTDAERFGWMAPFALAGLAAVLAVFPSGATALAWWAKRRSLVQGAGRVLALGIAWTVAEWLRGHLFTGFPWNLGGYAWAVSDAMIQSAAITGVYGLSLLAVACAGMPATLGDPTRSRLRGVLPSGIAAAVLVGLWIAGAARLADAGPAGAGAMVPGVGLRLVQPNIDQSDKWRADLREAHLARYLDMTIAPGARLSAAGSLEGAPVTHVIWPEMAVPFFLEQDSARRASVAAAVPADGLVVTGAPRVTPRDEQPFRVWNSIHAVDSEGAIVGTYDKYHLVPFGEYLPLRRYIAPFLDVSKITQGSVDFSAGPGPRTLRLAGLPPVSPLICYEAIFPGEVLDADDRPAWLLNLTNDGWFGISSGPYQHFESARLRAVEEGLPLVRVANTGISGVIDPYGRVLAVLGLGRAGVIDSGLPAPLADATIYARLGDWVLICLLIAAAALAGAVSRPS
jgi:apolipoprotein N-acyltransferase